MHNDLYETKPYRWVIVELDPSDPADKRSLDHARAGIGYYIISGPRVKGSPYIAAYKHFGGKLYRGQLATEQQSQKLEELDSNRYHWHVVKDAQRKARIAKENYERELQLRAMQASN